MRPWHAPLAPPRPAAPSSPIHPSVAGGPPPGPPTLRLAPQETSADARSAAPPASDVRDLDQGHLFGHVYGHPTPFRSRRRVDQGLSYCLPPTQKSDRKTSELQSLMRITYAVFRL